MDTDKDLLKELMNQDNDFLDFWDHYKVNELRFPNRKIATFSQWQKRSRAARKAIRDMVQEEGAPEWKNPYFFVQDFPEPQPQFLSGQEQDRLREQGIPLVQVKYNGKFLICTRETMQLFNLEYVRNWN